jgi:5S rRNA maturation endonuclease (ribonuclease M5)
MSTDVRGYLLGKGLNLKTASGYEVHIPCMFHGEDSGSRGRLYVNTDPDAEIAGLFQCKVCDARGALPSIKKFFGDAADEADEVAEMRLDILMDAARFYHERLGEQPDVFAYLKGPKRLLTTETIINRMIGYAPDPYEESEDFVMKAESIAEYLTGQGYDPEDIVKTGLCYRSKKSNRLIDSLRGMITIPYFVAGSCVSIRGRAWPNEEGGKYKTLSGHAARLYNSAILWEPHKEVAVCEGEFDAMVLEQLGIAAVAAPGTQSWKDAWDSYFDEVRRVWVVFDNDEAGEKGADKVLSHLGSKGRRVRFDEPGRKCDATNWVARGNDAESFAKLCSNVRGGLLCTVQDAFEEHELLQSMPGIAFNCETLDTKIAPGLQPTQVMVVLARTGVGKTLFLLNAMQRILMVPGQEELRFLFFSLEQTRGEWWERARRIYRFYNLDSTDAEALDFWRDRLMIVDANRVSPDQFKQAIDDFDYSMGAPPNCVLVDYLGYWAQSFGGERYQRTSDAIMEIKGLAKSLRLPFIVPHQVNRVAGEGQRLDASAGRDSGVVEETADFLFTLWSEDNNLSRTEEEKTGLINMQIAKSRHGNKGQTINYHWAPLSLAMVPQYDPLAQRAKNEIGWAMQNRDSWPKAVYRHRTGYTGLLSDDPVAPI